MPKAPRPLGSIHLSARSHQLDTMARTVIVTKVGLAEIGQTHRYAAHTVTTTLAVVQTLIQVADCARRMTPAKKIALHRLIQEYLWAMLIVTAEAGGAIQETLGQPGLLNQIGRAERCRIDQIAKLYVHHMRTILWR